MRAVGYQTPRPIDDPAALVDVTLPTPQPGGRDLLVAIRAVSVNPVDTKVRAGVAPEDGGWKVLGWDASGIVEAVGPDVTLFAPGDPVFYAGALGRPGTNAEFHLVDERIVGRKPASLSFAEAAALPLTAITAWEALFERLRVAEARPAGAAILIVGGAGGVGSIATQLARQLTDLTVITTASRPETAAWSRDLGAHHVVDHTKPLAAEIAGLGVGAPFFVFSTTGTEAHLGEIAALIAPQGRFAADRRSRPARRGAVQAQERVDALGVHVHAVDVRHARHRRPGRAPQRGVPARRRRPHPHDAGRDLRGDQCGKPPPRPRPHRERAGEGQDRAGGVFRLTRRRAGAHPPPAQALRRRAPADLAGTSVPSKEWFRRRSKTRQVRRPRPKLFRPRPMADLLLAVTSSAACASIEQNRAY